MTASTTAQLQGQRRPHFHCFALVTYSSADTGSIVSKAIICGKLKEKLAQDTGRLCHKKAKWPGDPHLGRWLKRWSQCWFSSGPHHGHAGKILDHGEELFVRSKNFRVNFTSDKYKGDEPLSMGPVLDQQPQDREKLLPQNSKHMGVRGFGNLEFH